MFVVCADKVIKEVFNCFGRVVNELVMVRVLWGKRFGLPFRGIFVVGGESIIEYEGGCAFAREVEPELAEVILVVGEGFELVVVFIVVVVEPLVIHQ